MKQRFIIIAIIVVALAILFSFFFQRIDRSTTAKARYGSIYQAVSAEGKIEGEKQVDLCFTVAGRIKQIPVKEGDFIKEGSIVAVLENDELQAEVSQANAKLTAVEADLSEVLKGAREQEVEEVRAKLEEMKKALEQARRDYERSERLFKDNAISQSRLEQDKTGKEISEAKVNALSEQLSLLEEGSRKEDIERAGALKNQAKAQLDFARAMLDKTYLYAPFSGKVMYKFAEIGETVGPTLGNPPFIAIITLADTSKLKVRAEIDETDIGKVSLGQSVEVTASAYRRKVFPGVVSKVGHIIGKRKIRPEEPAKIFDTKILEVEISLKTTTLLKPGMSVDVKIVSAQKEKALIIPLSAVKEKGWDKMVYVLQSGRKTSRKVKLGLADDEDVEILSGLKLGERVYIAD